MHKSQKPKFTLLAAVSLDGRITRGGTEGSAWTSPEDKKWFRRELARYDAVLMGRRTFDAACLRRGRRGRQVRRPLVPRNRIVFTQTQLFCCSQEHQHNRCTTAFFGGAGKLRKLLASQNWTRIAIVGGTSIYDWFLKRGLVDELYLTFEPVIFGKGKLFSARFSKSPRVFRLASMKKLNREGTLLLHYKK